MRRRYGITFENGERRTLFCVVTGEMSDGRKVWTEIDPKTQELIIDRQYRLMTVGNWSFFEKI